MTAVLQTQRKLSLKIEAPLYSLLERHADENGEALNELVCRLLLEAMDDWCDYCSTVQQIASDSDRPVHVCVGK